MQQQPTYEEEIDLLEYWDVICRGKKIIISLFLVSVLITMVVNLRLPNYYKATTTAMATEPETGGLGAALSASPLAGAFAGATGIQTPADKVMIILKSRTTAEAVIRQFDLLKIFNDDAWNATDGTWKNPDSPPFMEDAVKQLTGITVFNKTKEGAITVTVEWTDPKLAANIANYYIAALTSFLNKKAINITIQVVDQAVPAKRKSRPKIKRSMLLAGMMSLIAALFIVFFLAYLERTRDTHRGRNGHHNDTAASEERRDTPE